MTDLIMCFGENYGSVQDLGLEKPLNTQSSIGCSVEAWKTKILKAMQTMEAWLEKFQNNQDSSRAICVIKYQESVNLSAKLAMIKRLEPLH